MLTSRAYKYMKGKHNRKTSAFVKAALAYCHITAPSVSDLYTRFSLLIACAEAALYNCCLPQTDTFLKAAISLLPDLPVCLQIFCSFYNIYLLWNPCFLLFLLFLFFKWKYDTIVTLTATMAATMIVTVAVTATITEYLLLFYMKSLPHSLLMCLTYFLSFIPYHSNLTISKSTLFFGFGFGFCFCFCLIFLFIAIL